MRQLFVTPLFEGKIADEALLGELAHFFFLQARGEEGAEVAQGVFGVEVFLEERLEGDLAGAATTGHGGNA